MSKKITAHYTGKSPFHGGTPGLTDSTADYLLRMSRQMCNDQRVYWMGRVVEDPAYCRGECFVVEPFTDPAGRRMYRAESARMRMHG